MIAEVVHLPTLTSTCPVNAGLLPARIQSFAFALALFVGASRSGSTVQPTITWQDQSDHPREDVVSVHVTKTDGSGQENAGVLLRASGSLLGLPLSAQEKWADVTGRARFDHVPNGHYYAIARWEPQHDLRTRPSSSTADTLPVTSEVWWSFSQEITPSGREVQLTLSRGGKQTLSVHMASGKSIKDLDVRAALRSGDGLTAHEPPADQILQLHRYVHPVDGRFVFDGLAPGEWSYVISIPKYGRSAELSLRVPTESVTEVVVPAFLSISGDVRTSDGRPSPHAWVGAEYESTYVDVFEDGQVAAYTDNNGHFVIANARPGPVVLKAQAESAPGMTPSVAQMSLQLESGKDVTDIRLALQPPK